MGAGAAVTTWTQAQIDTGQVVYVHDGSNTTSDSITFTVDDGQGNSLAGQTFALTITAVDDDAPTQVNNTGSTVAEGGTDTITTGELRYDDSEQAAGSVTYTINSGPKIWRGLLQTVSLKYPKKSLFFICVVGISLFKIQS